MTLGFDLRSRIQRTYRPTATEKPRIKTGDIVRQRGGGPLLYVHDICEGHVYCTYAASSGVALIDPFSAERLEVVS